MKSISFVSFKGGAGRSVLMSNVAFQLACSMGKRVGCLDADFESGGLHTVMDIRAPYDQFELGEDQLKDTFPSQVYLMVDPYRQKFIRSELGLDETPEFEEPEFVHKYFSIDVAMNTRSAVIRDKLANKAGSLSLIPASPNARFTSQLDARGGNLYANFSSLINNYAEGDKLDVLCVDCRAGISNLAIPALAYVDAVVVCMRWGRQHRAGTKRFVKWFHDWLSEFQKDIKIFLIISLMDHESGQIQDEVKEFISSNKLDDMIEGFYFVSFVDTLTHSDCILLGEENKKYTDNYLNIGNAILEQI